MPPYFLGVAKHSESLGGKPRLLVCYSPPYPPRLHSPIATPHPSCLACIGSLKTCWPRHCHIGVHPSEPRLPTANVAPSAHVPCPLSPLPLSSLDLDVLCSLYHLVPFPFIVCTPTHLNVTLLSPLGSNKARRPISQEHHLKTQLTTNVVPNACSPFSLPDKPNLPQHHPAKSTQIQKKKGCRRHLKNVRPRKPYDHVTPTYAAPFASPLFSPCACPFA